MSSPLFSCGLGRISLLFLLLFQDILLFALADFKATDVAAQMGNSVRLVSWAGIRYMINEVGELRNTYVCMYILYIL